MAIFLVVVEENHVSRVEVSELATVAGRSPALQIPVKDPLVSERHCSFQLVEKKAFMTDLHSSEGTFINERPINHSFIYIGDRIRIGSVALFLDPSGMSPEEMGVHKKKGCSFPPFSDLKAKSIEWEEKDFEGEKDTATNQSFPHSLEEKLDLLIFNYLERATEAAGTNEKAISLIKNIKEEIKKEILQILDQPGNNRG